MANFNFMRTQPADGANLDAFNRQRVSNLETELDVSRINTKRTDLFDEKTVGTGSSAYRVYESALNLSVTTTGDKAISQTKRNGYYQPGKSLLVEITGILDADGQVGRIGYFDDLTDKTVDIMSGGVFFEDNNGTISVVKRSCVSGSQVDTRINQADWNLDVMDGTGRSGKTFAVDKTNIFVFDGQWLGVGRVRLGLVIDGLIYYVHEFNHAGIEDTTYMTTFNYPLRWEIISNGGAGEIKAICGSISSEGGYNPLGFLASYNFGNSKVSVSNGTEKYLLAVRAKNTNLRIPINLRSLYQIIDANNPAVIRVYIADSLTGGTWSNNGLDSEINTTFTSITGSRLVFSSYLSDKNPTNSDRFFNQLITGSDIAGNSEIIIISAEGLGNTSIALALNYQELA